MAFGHPSENIPSIPTMAHCFSPGPNSASSNRFLLLPFGRCACLWTGHRAQPDISDTHVCVCMVKKAGRRSPSLTPRKWQPFRHFRATTTAENKKNPTQQNPAESAPERLSPIKPSHCNPWISANISFSRSSPLCGRK